MTLHENRNKVNNISTICSVQKFTKASRWPLWVISVFVGFRRYLHEPVQYLSVSLEQMQAQLSCILVVTVVSTDDGRRLTLLT